MMIHITIYELPYEPALAAYWPSHICDYNQVEEISESLEHEYDAYDLYLPMTEFFERIALSSTNTSLDRLGLVEHDQFESVLRVLDSVNPIPTPQEPSMISCYSNTELPAMISSLLEVNISLVESECQEGVKKCLTAMIGFLTMCHMSNHTAAVCSTTY